MIFRLFVCLLLSSSLFAKSPEKALSVVIVGAGPAGIATSIEARLAGAEVTLIEKRTSYSRVQSILVIPHSLYLLKKWQVTVPQMRIFPLGFGFRMGIVGQLKDLEEALQQRAKELGVHCIQADFQRLDGTFVLCKSPLGNFSFPYDVCIGADGAHSDVREFLGIECERLGSAKGIGVLVRSNAENPLGFSGSMKCRDFYIRKISTPSMSYIFAQGPQNIDRHQLAEAAHKCGWEEEARAITADQTDLFIADIEIYLQQAQTFSNKEFKAILVGDAAATASFFEGNGANTALKGAEIVGRFLERLQSGDKGAYRFFNRSMKKTTDSLISESRYLFES